MMKRRWYTTLSFFVFFAAMATAQTDSLPENRSELLTESKFVRDSSIADSINYLESEGKAPLGQRIFGEYPKPRTALIMSLILPGAGQAYNKKYWKVPIVYGALGYMAWRISENQEVYRQRRDAYTFAITGDSALVVAPELQGLPASSLRILRDNSKKQLESNWIFLVLTYALNGIDAYVDAHLLDFDVSEDLSIQLDPALINDLEWRSATPNTVGIKLSMSF